MEGYYSSSRSCSPISECDVSDFSPEITSLVAECISGGQILPNVFTSTDSGVNFNEDISQNNLQSDPLTVILKDSTVSNSQINENIITNNYQTDSNINIEGVESGNQRIEIITADQLAALLSNPDLNVTDIVQVSEIQNYSVTQLGSMNLTGTMMITLKGSEVK